MVNIGRGYVYSMINFFKKRVVRIFLLLVLFSLGCQEKALSEGFQFRKYAGEFLEIGVAPRAQALGGGFTALAGDITAAYYNPAGLINLTTIQLSFLHTQQMLASVNYDFLAFGKPQNKNRAFAISLIRLGIDNIKDSRSAQVFYENDPDNWRINWEKVSSFNAADYVLTFSVAQRWVKGWVLGGNLKLIRRNLAEHSANGLGMDLAVQKKFSNKLSFGANLRNATSTLISWDTGEKELVKPVLYLGGAYQLNMEMLRSVLTPVLDVIFRSENRLRSARANWGFVSADVTGGLEYVYRKTLSLRMGVDEVSRINAGLGVVIPHLQFDYAFTNYDTELGNSHRIGVVVIF